MAWGRCPSWRRVFLGLSVVDFVVLSLGQFLVGSLIRSNSPYTHIGVLPFSGRKRVRAQPFHIKRLPKAGNNGEKKEFPIVAPKENSGSEINLYLVGSTVHRGVRSFMGRMRT